MANNSEDVCTPQYFCDNQETMQWEVDEESIYSLRNWFTEFNLECQPGTVIGTFGSIFFFGDLAGGGED